jgi:arginine decarboxylase
MPHIIPNRGGDHRASRAAPDQRDRCRIAEIEPVPPKLGKGAHPLLVEMKENFESLSPDRPRRRITTPSFGKERAQELFASGVLSLRDRANVETFYLCTMNALAHMIEEDKAAYPEIVGDLESTLIDRYFCNFSVFQSLPDNWAINQLFPIMPIHRLHEQPTRRGTIQDITCDSDGVIDRFVGGRKGNLARAASGQGRRALLFGRIFAGGLPGNPG